MNLHQVDLNLLVLFEALYRHKSVSIAAQEICISQSAFSHGLSRLRKRLNDQLFIRINNVMEPTQRSIELALHLQSAFPLIKQGLKSSESFNPLQSDITFKITATDYTEYSLLPKLMPHLERVAPNIKLAVLPASQLSPSEQLENNDVDFSLGFSHQQFNSANIAHITWLTDSYCTLVNKAHPDIINTLSLAQFLSSSHILIAPWGEKQGVVDEALATMKLTREIAMQIPSLLVAPHIIKETNYLLTLPKLIAKQFSQQYSCNYFDTPLKVPNYQLNIYWHKINSDKASFKWFIEQINMLFSLST